MLGYIQEALTQILTEDGLCVVSEGMGMEKIVTQLVKFHSLSLPLPLSLSLHGKLTMHRGFCTHNNNQDNNLVFLVNFSNVDEKMYMCALAAQVSSLSLSLSIYLSSYDVKTQQGSHKPSTSHYHRILVDREVRERERKC